MSRFFFHVHDGSMVLDLEGKELSEWQAAYQEARVRTAALLANPAVHFEVDELWYMEVADENGLLLFRLDLLSTLSPALNRHADVAMTTLPKMDG